MLPELFRSGWGIVQASLHYAPFCLSIELVPGSQALLALEVTEMIADGADSKLSCVVSHGKSQVAMSN